MGMSWRGGNERRRRGSWGRAARAWSGYVVVLGAGRPDGEVGAE